MFRLFAYICFCLLLLPVHSLAVSAPDTGFIGAALYSQNQACGGLLEVNYTGVWDRQTDGVADKHVVWNHRYIRTSHVVRIDTKRDGVNVRSASFDRQARQLVVLDSNGSDTGAGIGDDWGAPFTNREFFETAGYLLGKVPLYERIRSGAVAEQTEKVGGGDCWRVDVPGAPDSETTYAVWIDSAIGCNPRRIEVKSKNQPPDVITFEDYREVGSGLWFPSKMTLSYSWPAEKMTFTYVNTVDSIKVGNAVVEADANLKIPKGTTVMAAGAEFEMP